MGQTKISDFSLSRLPSKLKVWHTYAENFVKVLYQKTAMFTLSTKFDEAKFQKYHFDMFYNYEAM